jgi:hypothetical protein
VSNHDNTFQPLAPHHPVLCSCHWTPEQALAVLELLDELRELIWSHYDMQLLDEFHKHR